MPLRPHYPADYGALQWLRETIKPVASGGAFPSVSLSPMAQIRVIMSSGAMHSSSDATSCPRAWPPLSARTGSDSRILARAASNGLNCTDVNVFSID